MLFLDARQIFEQIDRTHREWSAEQLLFISNVVRLYRGIPPQVPDGAEKHWERCFADGYYADVPGLCKVATLDEIEQRGWTLNPGRYVGLAPVAPDDIDVRERLAELNRELDELNKVAAKIETRIAQNVTEMLR